MVHINASTLAPLISGTGRPIRVVDLSTRGTSLQHVTTATPIDLDTPGIVKLDYGASQYVMKNKAKGGVRLGNNKLIKTKAERDQKRKQAKASKKRNRK